MKYNQKTTVNALSLTITTACLILLSGCSKKNYDEDYTICVINDSPTSISISIKSGWEQQLEPYGHTGDLNPIYHIPKTETIEWTRGGQDYSEEIPIKQLLDGYNKTMGNIFWEPLII